jgi:hypothetical protein
MSRRAAIRAQTRSSEPGRHSTDAVSKRAHDVNVLGPSNQAQQAKLRIGAPNDPSERRARQSADAVTRNLPQLTNDAKRHSSIGKQEKLAHADAAIPAFLRGGAPLSPALRRRIEPHVDADIGNIRVHNGGAPALAAQAIGARAFTLGHHIAFAPGEFHGRSGDGLGLIAHEASHAADAMRGADTSVIRRDLKTDMFRRPLTAADFKKLSADEIKELHSFLEGIIVSKSFSPEDEAPLYENLAIIRAEMHRQFTPPPAAPPPAPKPPPIPGMKAGSDVNQLTDAGQIVDSIVQIGSDAYEYQIYGETKQINEKSLNEIRSRVRAAFNDLLSRASNKAASASSGYKLQSDVDKKHYLVAPVIKFIGQVRDPAPDLYAQVNRATASVEAARTALTTGRYAVAAQSAADAELAARRAFVLYQTYWTDIINTGEATITVLEYTRDAAFVTLAILATIASAGAAAGSTAAFLGGSAEAATATATVAGNIATFAPVVAQLGEAGLKVASGDKVDWGELAIDMAFTIVMRKFGPRLSGGIASRLIASNPAAKQIEVSAGKYVLTNIVTSVLTGKATALLRSLVEAGYRTFAPDKKSMTWGDFVDYLAAQALDPKSNMLDILTGAIGGYGQAAAAKKAAASPGASKPSQIAAPQKEEPTAKAAVPVKGTAPRPDEVPTGQSAVSSTQKESAAPAKQQPAHEEAAAAKPAPKEAPKAPAAEPPQPEKPATLSPALDQETALPAEPAAMAPSTQTTLIGSSEAQFRRDATRLISRDQNHPLRFLLGTGGNLKRTRGLTHAELVDRPDLVQMGHLKSSKAGGNRIVLQDAWMNQIDNITIEHSRNKGSFVEQRGAVDIGGVGVEINTAMMWEKENLIPQGTVAAAKKVQ